MATRGWRTLALVLGIFGTCGLWAAQKTPEADAVRRIDDLHAQAQRKLAEIDGQLQRGEWAAAEGVLRARLDALLKNDAELFLSPGPTPAEALARLAVAEAGLGREEEAVWHWHVAWALAEDALDPEQLRLFGAPGALLARHARRRLDEAPAGVTVRRAGEPGVALVPPHKLEGTVPPLPAGSAPATHPEWLRLQVVVGADGKASQPVLRQSTSWRLTYRLLESLRSWRFAPARLGGEAVAAFHELSINPPADSPPLEQLSQPVGEIAQVAALLRAGQWEKADKRGARLWQGALHGNLQSRTFYGLALALRALADAGRDRTDEAVCRWQAAQALDPRLYHADLSAYGAPGELLERHRWGLAHPPGSIRTVGDSPVQRPEIRSRVQPLYPEFRRAERAQGTVIVEAIIDERGVVRDARILKSGPGLDFDVSSMDAVCAWRFAPARYENRPVKVYYALTVNFEVR